MGAVRFSFVGAVAAVIGIAVVATIAPSANAAVVHPAPWQSDVCITSACSWSPAQNAFVAGGDGISIEAYIDSSTAWGNDASSVLKNALQVEEKAVGKIPGLRWVPTLRTITLGTAAFAVGWKIGSTLNTKWFHLDGAALGVRLPPGSPCSGGSQAMQGTWLFSSDGIPGFSPTYGPRGPGWYFKAIDNVCNAGNRVEWTPNLQCTGPNGTCTSNEIDRLNGAAWVATLGGGWQIDNSRSCGTSFGCFYFRWLTESQMEGALRVDQPLQPYGTQPWGIGSGWPNPTGCGYVSDICGYPGSQTNPSLNLTRLRCQLTGSSTDCGSGSPLVCVPADGTGFYGGAGSTGCGLGEAVENELNCRADPQDYVCPTTTSEGTRFDSSGGGRDGDDGTPTLPAEEPCKFDSGASGDVSGLTLWEQYNYDGAYDAECAEAFAILRDQGLLNTNNLPTQLLKDNAEPIIRADRLGNTTVQEAMLSEVNGSTLTEWFKMSSDRFTTSAGHPFELHFYLHPSTGTVLYDDFFVVFKVTW